MRDLRLRAMSSLPLADLRARNEEIVYWAVDNNQASGIWSIDLPLFECLVRSLRTKVHWLNEAYNAFTASIPVLEPFDIRTPNRSYHLAFTVFLERAGFHPYSKTRQLSSNIPSLNPDSCSVATPTRHSASLDEYHKTPDSQSEVSIRGSTISISSDDEDDRDRPRSGNCVIHIRDVTLTSRSLRVPSGPPIVVEGTSQDFCDSKKRLFMSDHVYGVQRPTKLSTSREKTFILLLWPAVHPRPLNSDSFPTLVRERNILTSLNTIEVRIKCTSINIL
jgi:hypothetical protein